MNLFKNGVGRPSNETIKKRRIFYVAITFAIILVLGLGTYLLTNINSSSKLKGALTAEQFKIDFEGKSYGMYISNFTWSKRSIRNLSSITAEMSGKSGSFYAKVTNNTRAKKYYQIYSHNTISSESALNKNTFDSKSGCLSVEASQSTKYSYEVNVTENEPIAIVVVKGFETKDACMQDSYGTNKNDNSVSKTLIIARQDYTKKIEYEVKGNVIGVEIIKKGGKTTVKEPKFSQSQLNELKGYEITSWRYDCGERSYKPGQTIEPKNCLSPVLSAIGKNTNKFTVKYDKNKGNGIMFDKKIKYGKSTALSANLFTRSGYKFNGWVAVRKSDDYTYGYDSNGKLGWYEKPAKNYIYKNKQKVSQTVVAGQTVTMYAQWKRK